MPLKHKKRNNVGLPQIINKALYRGVRTGKVGPKFIKPTSTARSGRVAPISRTARSLRSFRTGRRPKRGCRKCGKKIK